MVKLRTVPKELVLKRIRLENTWWREPGGILTEYKKMKARAYLKSFLPLISQRLPRRAVVLMGPRRVGKTVMIHHAIQSLLDRGIKPKLIYYISVDHPIYNGLSLEDLVELYSKASGIDPRSDECFVFFDEIQYLRNWEQHLKVLVDDNPNLKCVASGSAAAALRLKSTESGAGRFTEFLLPPLTFYEYLELLEKRYISIETEEDDIYVSHDIEKLNAAFLDYVNFGGYPEVIFSERIQQDPARFIKADIIDKVLLRDLPSLYGIKDIQELNSLFTYLAYNTAGEVSLEGMSQHSGVAKNTLKRYIEYLEAAFLLRVVHRVDQKARRFSRVHHFKVYLTNPSMRSALFSPVEANDASMGRLIETAIFSQWFHLPNRLHYARWGQKKKREVDIIRLNPDQTIRDAIEVKWSDRKETPAALLEFCLSNNLSIARVTTKSYHRVEKMRNVQIFYIPASVYCWVLGYQIVQGLEIPMENRLFWIEH